jgi:putrescine aminotransferase
VSGGEAIDTAIKLARAHTKRAKIISAIGGYHGHTGFALAAGEEEFSAPFAPLPPGFVQIPFGDLNALENAMDDDTAAVLFETIPATMGIVVPPEDFYRGVRALCDRVGALMIADEVQSGLGRCGDVWAINTFGAIPDMIVTAKGLSGGMYPVTATIYSDRLDAFLRANPFIHISTAGGAEVGCYAALEVLNILQEPEFLGNVRAMAELFRAGLAELRDKYSTLLVEVRQRGLMMGLKFASPALGPLMTVAGFRFGLLMIYANYDTSVCQFLPPLIMQPEQGQETLMRLDKMLEWVSANAF